MRFLGIQSSRRWRTLVAIVLSIAALSCADAAKPDYAMRLATLRQHFSFYSMQADYDSAAAVLTEIEKIPGSEAEAAYGRAMIGTVNALAVFMELLNLVTVVSDGLAPPAQLTALATTAGGLTDLVHSPAKQLREKFAQLDQTLRAVIEEYPEGNIQLDEFAIYAGTIPLIVIRGDFDRGDLEVILAASNLVQGVMALVLTQDLGLKVTDIFSLIDWIKGKPYCKPTVFDDKTCLIKFLAYALETFPKMFALAPGGVEASQASLGNLVAALQHFQNFVELGQAETDDQEDDILTISLQPSASGSVDDVYVVGTRNYRFPTRDYFLADTVKAERRLVITQSGWERSSTELSTDSMAILDKFKLHLDGDGTRLDLQDFIRPMVELLLKVLIATNSVETGWGPFSDILLAFRNIEDKGISPPEFVLSIVNDVIPVGMVQLDLHGLLADGFALRSLMPHYDYYVGDDPEPYLALEWECGFEQTDTLVCRTSSDITDSAHFVGYDYSFADDGNADKLPYFAFQNPSLQGRFYLDASLAPQSVGSTPIDAPTGASPAQNRELNYVIHRVWDYFYTAIAEAGELLAPALEP